MTLTDVSANLMLYLVTFRRQVRKGMMPDINRVRQQLMDIFAEQQRIVQEDARLQKLYEKIRYILVVLADEILINSEWTYASAWEDQILEWEYYRTRIAGEDFFTRLENEGERDDNLAEIFYLALCLGFVGKYSDNPTKIQDLKMRLYRMLPGRFTDQDKRVTPDAYYVAQGVKDIYKPLIGLGRILIVCLILIIGLLIAYKVSTRGFTQKIRSLVAEMKHAIPPGKPPSESAAAAPIEIASPTPTKTPAPTLSPTPEPPTPAPTPTPKPVPTAKSKHK